jgi:hypothetical protein
MMGATPEREVGLTNTKHGGRVSVC